MAEVTPQRAAQIIVDEVLQNSCPEAARLRVRMIEAGMKPRVPHLTRSVRWTFVNMAIRALARSD
jgi:hypothetical protein